MTNTKTINQRFVETLQHEHLYVEGQQVLAAVSGGRDSVTLVHLLASAKVPFAIAHCNFHLRPDDCDRDEAFVRRLAEKYGVRCYVAQFNTEEYAAENDLSIEDAARRQRYAFFEEVRQREGLDLIATAHHRDDAIETFFINLLRGTGVRGLRGIPMRNGNIIRPMLVFGREEIDRYVKENSLDYVDDYTNDQNVYLRNRIRHQLMPLMRELSPSFDATMQGNMARIASAERLMSESMKQYSDRLVHVDCDKVSIDIDALLSLDDAEGVLFELLYPYGFKGSQVNEMMHALRYPEGQRFESNQKTALIDRNHIVIYPKITKTKTKTEAEYIYSLERDTKRIDAIGLTVSQTMQWKTPIKLSSNEACFDFDKLHFPLRLRHWHDGDRFRPFGMKGGKLVSDLFVDLKLNIVDKSRVWILCDAQDEILWVVGCRASSHCAVTAETKTMYKLTIAEIL